MQSLSLAVYSLIILSIVFAALAAYFDANKLNSIAVILLAVAFAIRIGAF